MSEITQYKPGTFCWVELATFDAATAKKFYGELFGWETFDIPLGDGTFYTMLNIKGKSAAALYLTPPEKRNAGIPSHWMSYISVEKVEDTLARVREFGGTVILEAMDVMGAGRMGVLQDPDGAVVALWEPKEHKGAAYLNEHGAMCWWEHGCHDKGKAIPFYEGVFGWTAKTAQMGPTEYTTFYAGEDMAAGLFVLPPEMSQIPSHWLPYFAVDNIDSSLEKVTNMNGKILMPKLFIEGVGFYGVFQDDQGAVLGLVQGQM